MSHFPAEDEVTGLAVSPDYIVAQFFQEPAIHVFSRKDKTLLHRLEGHEYGGQALQVLPGVLGRPAAGPCTPPDPGHYPVLGEQGPQPEVVGPGHGGRAV